MALQDTLAELSGKGPAAKNRVDILLDTLEGSEDGDTLATALRSKLTSASLTRALRAEYGQGIVTDSSVDAWRRKNLPSDLTGL